MIPLKLTLVNFMPYRDNVPPLDFTGIHTATISGDNGSGKSSIIDAITWALWDKTRAAQKDDVIHAGENDTQVEFEFAVGGQKYRVNRKRSRPKKPGAAGHSQLNFFIIGEDGARPIDGDTMTQTQQKIEEILHMDYETFTNSAYLRQGHADEFTTATPADRKKVLASILGLDLYENLEKRAREIANRRKISTEQLQNSIVEIEAELVQLPECETGLARAEADITEIATALKNSADNLQLLRGKKESLESKKAQLSQIEQAVNNNRQQLAQMQPQIQQLQNRIKEHETILAKRDEIERGYTDYVEARNQLDLYNKNLSVYTRITAKMNELEKIIEREKQSLLKEYALAQNRAEENKKEYARLTQLREELKQAQIQLDGFSGQEENLKQQKQAGQELLARIRSLEADKTRLERDITGINEKLHLLKNQPGAARCPMCGSDLGEEGILHIENEYENEKLKKIDLVKTDTNEINLHKTELKNLSEEINLNERTLSQNREKIQNKLGSLRTEITKAEEAGKQLQLGNLKQQEIEEQLNAKNYAVVQQEAIGQLIGELTKLEYDTQKHEQVRHLAESLQGFEQPKCQLDEAERLVAGERENYTALFQMARQVQATLKTDLAKREILMPEISALDVVNTELMQKDAEFKEQTLKHSQAQQKSGVIKGRLEYLQRQKVKKQEKAAQLKQSAGEEQIYRDLADAFGKKGVQALLIETALPEIENEANRLLSKMTDGRMSIKLETQGATQKGVATETLDINISDELGIRNYEMFSGGEAFRINFSIRIALSRLLARRAGAPLPTLIIDEGFGTQDAAGIEKLKEAIVSVQDDFEKILVITHIDELKDAFPARIDVTKTAAGSMFSLS